MVAGQTSATLFLLFDHKRIQFQAANASFSDTSEFIDEFFLPIYASSL